MTKRNTKKPTYEELEYDHAVLFAAYKDLKHKYQTLNEKNIKQTNMVLESLSNISKELIAE